MEQETLSNNLEAGADFAKKELKDYAVKKVRNAVVKKVATSVLIPALPFILIGCVIILLLIVGITAFESFKSNPLNVFKCGTDVICLAEKSNKLENDQGKELQRRTQ